jgi:hypothetical protein
VLPGRQSKGSGNMTMDPSHDFDFHFGSWKVQHRQLNWITIFTKA